MQPNAIARNKDTGAEVSAYVETDCTITAPDGTPITAGGAVITPNFVLCYVSGDGKGNTRGDLTTWHGEKIGTWRLVSSWKQIAPYGFAHWYTMRAISATIDGKDWHGRYNSDGGDLVKLRPYIERPQVDCPDCWGVGELAPLATCPRCNGHGMITKGSK